MPKFEISRSYAAEIAATAKALFEEHWEEVDITKDTLIVNINEEAYQTLEDYGMLLCLKATVDGEVVGYSICMVSEHIKYGGVLCAQNDALFLKKEYRKGTYGLRLINATEAACKERGVKIMFWGAKPDSTFADLLKRRGLKVEDIIYSKEL